MKFLKKYKWRIAWFILWTFIVLYFIPRQNDFYLHSDKQSFSSLSQRIFLFFEGAVLTFLIIWLSLKVEATGLLKRTGAVLQSTLIVIFYLAFFYMIFKVRLSDQTTYRRYITGRSQKRTVQYSLF